MSQGTITTTITNEINPRQREFWDVVTREMSISHAHEVATIKLAKAEPGSEQSIALLEKIEQLELKMTEDVALRYFFYGGSIRGGKTTVCLALLVFLAAKIYPGSRWAIVRKSFPVLIANVVPALQGMLRYSKGLYWKRAPSDYFVQFPNGSRIYLVSESYAQDKQLTKFLGMEMNGFVIEQMEEIQHETFKMIQQRAGTYVKIEGPKPPPIIIANFNPTYTWVKEQIYDKWKKGELLPPYYFCEALTGHNSFNTKEMYQNWSNLDEETYNRMIKGHWDLPVKRQFFSGFSDRNISKVPLAIQYEYDIWLSFDFNVDPMTCVIAQTDGETFVRIIREFRIPNSDTPEMCEQIKPYIKNVEHNVFVTGDASGKNRNSGLAGHINHYQIIKEKLGLANSQFRIPGANPGITDSRVFVNSLLSRLPEFVFDPGCEHAIKDMRFVLFDFDKDGNVVIAKTGTNEYLGVDNKQLSHFADLTRYLLHATFTNWLKIPKS